MEVQRLLSGKPDLEIKGTPEATGRNEVDNAMGAWDQRLLPEDI